MKKEDTNRKSGKKVEEFYNVLGEKKITTVFQPILDLWQKEVLGYEALSRVTDENMDISIKEMFQTEEAVGEPGSTWNKIQADGQRK